MNEDEQPKHCSEADAELEREIRSGRKFSLEEAIARLAGPNLLKGESPISLKDQAEAAIDGYLRLHLIDSAGVLPLILLRHIENSEFLLENLEQPFVVLAGYVQRILESEYLLAEFVREADAEWGRVLGERPFFERAGTPSRPDDPYTIESVRIKLSQLKLELGAGDAMGGQVPPK